MIAIFLKDDVLKINKCKISGDIIRKKIKKKIKSALILKCPVRYIYHGNFQACI
jgi:hypothetical protein